MNENIDRLQLAALSAHRDVISNDMVRKTITIALMPTLAVKIKESVGRGEFAPLLPGIDAILAVFRNSYGCTDQEARMCLAWVILNHAATAPTKTVAPKPRSKPTVKDKSKAKK